MFLFTFRGFPAKRKQDAFPLVPAPFPRYSFSILAPKKSNRKRNSTLLVRPTCGGLWFEVSYVQYTTSLEVADLGWARPGGAVGRAGAGPEAGGADTAERDPDGSRRPGERRLPRDRAAGASHPAQPADEFPAHRPAG